MTRSRMFPPLVFLVMTAARPLSGQIPAGTPSAPAAMRLAPDGTPVDPAFFPIAVWLQAPQNAARYRAAGINVFVGLWQGPTDSQLAALKAAGMPVVCGQSKVGLDHRSDPTILAWMHGDEPDNAQPITDPQTGKRAWGGPVPPMKIVADYERMRAKDPTRPVMLNLGQGVANDAWKGRGSGARLDDYLTYVRGGDIISFDVYPVAGLGQPENLWCVAKGLDRLREWSGGKKTIWNCIECARIDGEGKPSRDQVRAEVWMSLIHGSRGIIYFVHQFKPAFDEHALLDDPELLPAVTTLNRQIRELAPVLNSPTIQPGVTAKSSIPTAPVDTMMKHHAGAAYVFAVGMRSAAVTAVFDLREGPAQATAKVIGEGRTIPLRHRQFEDRFEPFGVHLYKIR